MKKNRIFSLILSAALVLPCLPVGAQTAAPAQSGAKKYNFTAQNMEGYTQISSVAEYSGRQGYGFVSNTSAMPVRSVDTGRIQKTENGFEITEKTMPYTVTSVDTAKGLEVELAYSGTGKLPANLAAATYQNGKLTAIKLVDVTEAGKVPVPEFQAVNGQTKLFVWDSANGMKPLSNPYTVGKFTGQLPLTYVNDSNYNNGGLVFRVDVDAPGAYALKVETTSSKADTWVAPNGAQAKNLAVTEGKKWDVAGLVPRQNRAIWEDDHTWTYDYVTGTDYIEIEVEPNQTTGGTVGIKSISVEPIAAQAPGEKPTVYILGDSTVKSYTFSEAGMSGWGQVIDSMFDSSKVNVINYSMGGRSFKSMYTEGRFNDVLMTGRPGDVVLVQSGHNDESTGNSAGPEARFGRGSDAASYKRWIEEVYVPAIRARGMLPVMVTPMTRVNGDKCAQGQIVFSGFKNSSTPGIDFPGIMQTTARENGVDVVDLYNGSIEYLNTLDGPTVAAIYMGLEAGESPGAASEKNSHANGHAEGKIDGTHFKESASKQFARIVAEGLYDLTSQEGTKIKEYFTEETKEALATGDWSDVFYEMANDTVKGEGAYYRNQIEKLLQLGAMSKDANGNFNPKNEMTIGEFAQAITKLWGLNASVLSGYNASTALDRETMSLILYDAYEAKFGKTDGVFNQVPYMTNYNGTATVDPDNYDPNITTDTPTQYAPLAGWNALKDTNQVTPANLQKVKDVYELGLTRSEDGILRGKIRNGLLLQPQTTVTREKAAKTLWFCWVLAQEVKGENDLAKLPDGTDGKPAPAQKYPITITASQNGTVSTGVSAIAAGKKVTIKPDADSGYKLDTVTVTKQSGGAVEVNNLQFIMPAEAVTITATFVESGYGVHVGKEDFATVREAVAYAKTLTPTEANPTVINLDPGVYREQVIVETPYITIQKTPGKQGEAKITWYYGIGCQYYSTNASGFFDESRVGQKDYVSAAKNWGATLQVTNKATGFQAKDLTIENSYNYYVTEEELADGVKSAEPGTPFYSDGKGKVPERAGLAVGSKEVQKESYNERSAALHNSADKSILENCLILGSQDTMGANRNRMLFDNCEIWGRTDYICGAATAVFNQCDLKFFAYSDTAKGAVLTAPKTDVAQQYGYLFYNCRVSNTGTNTGQSNFGRNWSAEAQATFYNTVIENTGAGEPVIGPSGWQSMACGPELSRFFEYGSVDQDGKPVDTSKRIINVPIAEGGRADMGTVLNEWQILDYNPRNYLAGTDGWDPMNLMDAYAQVDAIAEEMQVSIPAGSETIYNLPAPESGYEYFWESSTPLVRVDNEANKITIARPAYGEPDISAQLTLYVRKAGTEIGAKADIPVIISATTSTADSYSVTGTASMLFKAEKDVEAVVGFYQDGAQIKLQKVTVPAGSESVSYEAKYVPAGEYDVKINCVTEGYKVQTPANGETTLQISGPVTLDFAVGQLEDRTLRVTQDPTSTGSGAGNVVNNGNGAYTVSATGDTSQAFYWDFNALSGADADALKVADKVTLTYTVEIPSALTNTSGNIYIDLVSGTPAEYNANANLARFIRAKVNSNWTQIDMIDSGMGDFSGSSDSGNQKLKVSGKFDTYPSTHKITLDIDFKDQKISATAEGSSTSTVKFDAFPSVINRERLCLAVYPSAQNSPITVRDIEMNYQTFKTGENYTVTLDDQTENGTLILENINTGAKTSPLIIGTGEKTYTVSPDVNVGPIEADALVAQCNGLKMYAGTSQSYSADTRTIDGVSYTGKISGTENPALTDNIPTAGTYVKLVASKPGTVTLAYKINSSDSKSFRVYTTDGTKVTEAFNTTGSSAYQATSFEVTGDEKEQKIYYAYINGSKMELWGGFTFKTIEEDVPAVNEIQAQANHVISITAKPEDGYQLASATVTGAESGNSVAVQNNQFTMPAEPVRVTASFAPQTTTVVSGTVDAGVARVALKAGGETIEGIIDGTSITFAEVKTGLDYAVEVTCKDYYVNPAVSGTGVQGLTLHVSGPVADFTVATERQTVAKAAFAENGSVTLKEDGDPSAADTVVTVFRADQALTAENAVYSDENITLSLGEDATYAATTNEDGSVNYTELDGIYYPGYLGGTNNPGNKDDGNGNITKWETGDNVPTAGCFYRFDAKADGQLALAVKRSTKEFRVVEAQTNDASVQNTLVSDNEIQTATVQYIDVTAGNSYFVYANGSKLNLYGFVFSKGTNASVSASQVMEPGKTVVVNPAPDMGYEVDSILVNGEALTPQNGIYSFVMPEEPVTVTPSFRVAAQADPVLSGDMELNAAPEESQTAPVEEEMVPAEPSEEEQESSSLEASNLTQAPQQGAEQPEAGEAELQ